jgi:hypothetical protein
VAGPVPSKQTTKTRKNDATQAEKREELAALASSSNPEQREGQQQQHQRTVLRSGFGGVVASLLAHLLLLALLALITLKMPPSPAGLAFESSVTETIEETLELSQPVAAEVADVQNPPTAEETPLDAVDELAELSSSVSELQPIKPVLGAQSGVAAAASAALSATSSAMTASASFFGAAAGGNSFCYIIDGSGSMRGGPWEAAKLELLKSLASLKSNQRFYIIFFNRELQAITLPGEREAAARALYATAENLQHARRWVETLTIGIGAPPNKALEMAISKEPDAIYLLTDGVTKVDVAAFLREANRVSDLINGEQILVPIHTIAFYSQEGQALLRRIAQENRGQFVYVPDPRN